VVDLHPGFTVLGAEQIERDYPRGPAPLKNGYDKENLLALLSGTSWLIRKIPGPDFLFGEVLSTTSHMEIVGPTGLGKSNFLLAGALAIADGRDFLHWRGYDKPRRILYIDGEMSGRQAKKRLGAAARRNGRMPPTLFYFNRDDFPSFPPLNTEAGQKFIDALIEDLGGVDLIIFDNVQALLLGDMREEQPWQETLPWVRSLTQRNIGQIWVHHTGHDESRGYGTKTREWQMDTVAIMERVQRPEADIAFQLSFPKSRERSPENRPDFEPTVITLTGDTWMSEKGNCATSRKKTSADLALEVLKDEIARGNGETPLANERIPPATLCLNVGVWRKTYELRSVAESPEAAERAFYRDAKNLQNRQLVFKHESWVWPAGRSDNWTCRSDK
jgi:AAA domain